MPRARILFPLLVLALTLLKTASGQENSAVTAAESRWKQTVEKFEKSRDELRSPLLRQLETAERRATNTGDPLAAAKFREEFEAFQTHGFLPASQNTNLYEKKLESANIGLKQAAKKIITALERQDALDTVAKIESELEALIAKPQEPEGPVSVSPGKDPRVAWVTQVNGNFFRLQKSGMWVETEVPTKVRYTWKEVRRNAELIELYDQKRSIGMLLAAKEAKVDYNYDPTARSAAYRVWNPGAWYDPAKFDPEKAK